MEISTGSSNETLRIFYNVSKSPTHISGYWWHFNEIWRAYVHPILIILAIISNLLTIIVIPRVDLQKHLKFYYASIAVSDILIILLIFLWLFTGPGLYFATDGEFNFYPLTKNLYICKFVSIFGNIAKNFSDYIYVFLGLDRIFAVFFPFKARASLKKPILYCLIILIVSSLYHFTMTWYYVTIVPNVTVTYENVECMADNTFKVISVSSYLTYMTATSVVQYIIHLIFVTVFNILLIHKLSVENIRRRFLIAQHQLKLEKSKRPKSENKLTIVLLGVSVIHLFANIPNAIFWTWLATMNGVNPSQKANRTPIWQAIANLSRSAQLMSIFDYMFNIIVYYLLIPSFKQELHFLFHIPSKAKKSTESTVENYAVY